MFLFEHISQDIRIEVSPTYIPEQSDPAKSFYFFAYKVKITNQSSTVVQLLKRRWVIVDGEGQFEEIEGLGVVGLQPKIGPGQTFEYSSFCPLSTPTGSMRGQYMFQNSSKEEFWAEIPQFVLCEPASYH